MLIVRVFCFESVAKSVAIMSVFWLGFLLLNTTRLNLIKSFTEIKSLFYN